MAVDFSEIEHRYFMSEQSTTGETKEDVLETLRLRGIQYDPATIRFENVDF